MSDHTPAHDDKAPRKTAPKSDGNGTTKSAAKSGRSRSREFALQGLYQFLVGNNEAADIDVFTRDLSGFHKSDSVHYDALLAKVIATAGSRTLAIERLLAALRSFPVLGIQTKEVQQRGVVRITDIFCIELPVVVDDLAVHPLKRGPFISKLILSASKNVFLIV